MDYNRLYGVARVGDALYSLYYNTLSILFILMEIVGVAASSIGLGRAIAAGRHIVNFFRELPETQHEFDELRKDVSLITAMLADIQRGAGPLGSRVTSNVTEELLIKRTTERLQEIRNELQEFVSRCGQTIGDKTIKTKRRRWILESDKLKKLREKAMDAKMNLHFAVTCHNRDIMRAQSESTGHTQVSKQLSQTEPSHELIRPTGISPHFKLALKQIVARQDEIGQSSVCETIQQGGSVEQVRAALAEDPWAVDECGYLGHSPHTLTIRYMPHSTEVAQLLIAAGANVNQEDTHGLTPLRAAAQYGHLGCIRLLSRKKRDPKVIEEIRQLLTMNSDTALEAQDGFGVTPVITAITLRNLPALRWLVNEGASLHVTTDLGRILHWVGFNLDLQILRYLECLELTGIDVTGRNGDGHTAWDYFIFTIYGPWRTLGTAHQPSLGEQHVFANLYKNIRNRTLMQDISRLRQILHVLSQQERAAACTLLQP
ncbi:hypothetical protein FDECE_10779 [Fusarium decemcellulare]|nr:hypothetical protein FDECE_10779 [Fusarium decemcellulare]